MLWGYHSGQRREMCDCASGTVKHYISKWDSVWIPIWWKTSPERTSISWKLVRCTLTVQRITQTFLTVYFWLPYSPRLVSVLDRLPTPTTLLISFHSLKLYMQVLFLSKLYLQDEMLIKQVIFLLIYQYRQLLIVQLGGQYANKSSPTRGKCGEGQTWEPCSDMYVIIINKCKISR